MPRARSQLPPSQRQYVKPRMPGFVEFQFPHLVDKPPSTPEWLHEIKHDGYRVQVHVAGGAVCIYTRNGLVWNDTFPPLPEVSAELAELPNCIIDAELCALGEDGMSDFFALRRSLSPGKTGGLVLFCFDLLWKDDEDLRPYALSMRKALLQGLLERVGSDRLRYVTALPQGGKAMLGSPQSLCARVR